MLPLLDCISFSTDLNYQLPSMGDAPTPIRAKFTAFSEEIISPAPQPLEHSTMLFMVGRSTGFTMGLYAGMAETTIKSWKADKQGSLHMATTKESTILPINGLHGSFSLLFGRAGDSGAAVLDRYGSFVGLYFAGNDYTGTGYFIPTDKLFGDIKHITKASDVEVL